MSSNPPGEDKPKPLRLETGGDALPQSSGLETRAV